MLTGGIWVGSGSEADTEMAYKVHGTAACIQVAGCDSTTCLTISDHGCCSCSSLSNDPQPSRLLKQSACWSTYWRNVITTVSFTCGRSTCARACAIIIILTSFDCLVWPSSWHVLTEKLAWPILKTKEHAVTWSMPAASENVIDSLSLGLVGCGDMCDGVLVQVNPQQLFVTVFDCLPNLT